jgi:hypothetical protein
VRIPPINAITPFAGAGPRARFRGRGNRLGRVAALAGLLTATTVLLASCDASSASTAASTSAAKTGPPASSAAKISEPGRLTLTPASGPSTASPGWTTKDGCPAGHNASAELVAFNLKGAFESRISLPIEGPGPYTSSRGAGVLDFNLKKVHLYATPDVGPDGTIEVAVGCYPSGAGLGHAVYVQSTFVHFSRNGATYTTSSAG